MRPLIAVGYTFAAWLFAGFFVDAGSRVVLAPRARLALRCAALLLCFVPVFRLYFARPDRLGPGAAAAVGLGFIALLDLLLLGRFSPRPFSFALSFWDWQLPALLVVGSIYVTGRAAATRR